MSKHQGLDSIGIGKKSMPHLDRGSGHYDQQRPSRRVLTSAHIGVGWGNPRTATALHVLQSDGTLSIRTTLDDLQVGTLTITFHGLYMIIEATLTATNHRGRYVRHVPGAGARTV